METDGGDKDSTDNPGEIRSTQQPEDPSEPVSFSSVVVVVSLVIFEFPTKPSIPAVDNLGTTV